MNILTGLVSSPPLRSVLRSLSVDPLVVLFTVVGAIAICFGVIWFIVNAYILSPALASWVTGAVRPAPVAPPPSTLEEPFPTIDVFLPAYEERSVIAGAIASLAAVSYPDDLYEIHVILEPDDVATRTTVERLSAEYDFRTHVTPKTYPGEPNKPRALNYAFGRTDRDLVCIVDAEDRVTPEFLRRTAAALQAGADYTLCHLDMVNEADGWVNTLFRAEYGYWYGLIVPGFTSVDFPVPLGGTSCGFHRSVLSSVATRRRELGVGATDHETPWDAGNVTEDFELGLFLWLEGYEFAYLPTTVYEESPPSLDGWIRQRTRWKKGKLHTLLLHLHNPVGTRRQRAHVLFQSALPHLGPVNIAGIVLLLMFATMAGWQASVPARAVLAVGLAFLLIFTSLYCVGYWLTTSVPLKMRVRQTIVIALTAQFYWLLQWGADLRAMYQLYIGDSSWEVTQHLGRVGDRFVSGDAVPGTDAGTEDRRRTEFSTTDSGDLFSGADPVRTASTLTRDSIPPGVAPKDRETPTDVEGDPLRRGGTSVDSPLDSADSTTDFANDPTVDPGTGYGHRLSTGIRDAPHRIRSMMPTRIGPHLLLIPILAYAVAIRLYGFDRWSLWLDEIYSVTIRTQAPLGELLFTPIDPHPPLYFLLLRGWFSLLGTSEVSGRLFSLVFSVSAVLALFILVRRFYDEWTGVFAALLLATMPIHVHLGRNIRMYSLFVFLTICSYIAFLRLADRSRSWSATYVVVTVAMLYTHVYAIFVIASQVVAVLLTRSPTVPSVDRAWKPLTMAWILFFPWMVVVTTQVLDVLFGEASAQVTWIPEPTLQLLRDTLLQFAGFPVYYPIIADSPFLWWLSLFVLGLLAGLVVAGVLHYDPETDRYSFDQLPIAGGMAVLFVMMVFVPFALSYVFFPIYFPRFTVVATIPIVVLAARGLRNVHEPTIRRGLVLFLLVTAATSTAVYYSGETQEPWAESTAVVADSVGEDGAIVVQPYWLAGDPGYFQYYYAGPDVPVVGMPDSEDAIGPAEERRIDELAADHERICVFSYDVDGPTVAGDILAETHEIGATYRRGVIVVECYDDG